MTDPYRGLFRETCVSGGVSPRGLQEGETRKISQSRSRRSGPRKTRKPRNLPWPSDRALIFLSVTSMTADWSAFAESLSS